MATMKSLYAAAAALLAEGLDSEADRYLNENRAGKTAPGAGLRYSLSKGQYGFVKRPDGRKFGRIADPSLLASLRDKFGNDPVIRVQIAEGFRRFYAANPDAPEGLGRFFDDPADTPAKPRTRKAAAA